MIGVDDISINTDNNTVIVDFIFNINNSPVFHFTNKTQMKCKKLHTITYSAYNDIARLITRPRMNRLARASVPAIIFAVWV